MDSFSEHFGFKFVEFEPWFKMRKEDSLIDQQGSFVIYQNGVAAGYLVSSNGREELQGGFIDKLGVIKSMQGKGLGRKLLMHGIAHSAQKGHTSIALGVDSGNESGAIALYESVGFEPEVVWSAYRLPRSSLSKPNPKQHNRCPHRFIPVQLLLTAAALPKSKL